MLHAMAAVRARKFCQHLLISRDSLVTGSIPMSVNRNLLSLAMVLFNHFIELFIGEILLPIARSFGETKHFGQVRVQEWLLVRHRASVWGSISHDFYSSFPQLAAFIDRTRQGNRGTCRFLGKLDNS